jgi:hypothetical protein
MKKLILAAILAVSAVSANAADCSFEFRTFTKEAELFDLAFPSIYGDYAAELCQKGAKMATIVKLTRMMMKREFLRATTKLSKEQIEMVIWN